MAVMTCRVAKLDDVGNSSMAESGPKGVTGKAHRQLNYIQFVRESSFTAVLPEFYAGAQWPLWHRLII
jgi:hypothetical protein